MRHSIAVTFVGLVVVCATASLLLSSASRSDAQSPPPLAGLEIALWPEYDRPEVLVIYRGTVATETALPATVRFDLPAGMPALNAVAYLDESRPALVNLTDFQLVTAGTGKALTLSTPARQFHVEYYAADLLHRQDDIRRLSYAFTATVAVADLRMEVQQPVGSSEFGSTPPPDTTETRSDGLTYAIYQMGPLAPGDTRALQATYRRTGDALSVTGITVPASATPVPPNATAMADSLRWIVVALVGAAVVGAVAFHLGRRGVGQPRARRPERTASVASEAAPAGYCHRCGTPLRPDGAFCHGCGAPRRVD